MPAEFPTLDGGNVVNSDVYAPSLRRDVPVGLSELSAHLDGVGNTLQEMAVRAADTQGKAAAAAAVQSGVIAPQNQNTAYGQSYNAVAKQGLGEQRRASIVQDVGTALANNPSDPNALKDSLAAIKAGYGATPYADLNVQLDGEFALHAADAMTRAQDGLHRNMVEQQQANYTTAQNTAASTLAQVASGAGFDTDGATRVAGAITSYANSLAQYGPREAFRIGDVQYPADPTRAGLISPVEINARAIAAAGEAKRSWILSAQRGLPDSASQAKFADDIRDRYEKGDPIFAGLDGEHAQSLFNALDVQAQKQGQDERIDQASHAQNAEHLIEALQWGSPVDIPTLKAEARASGDPGLAAKADFFATAQDSVRGVLKTVVARQLGLLPEPGAKGLAPVMLDAQGNPVASGNLTTSTAPGGRLDARAFFNSFVLPHEGGLNPHDANGSPTNFGINQAANPEIDVHKLTPQTAGDVFVNKYYAASGAANLPPALAAVHADTFFINEAAASRILKQSGGNPQTYMQLRQAWMAQDLQNNPAVRPYARAWAQRNADLSAYINGAAPATAGTGAAANPGAWTPPAGAVPGSPAYAAWANTKAGFSSDPIKFAQENAIASVPPMIPQAAFAQDPASQANWASAIKARYAAGQSLQASYGVPARMLTDAEKDDYKSYMQANPVAAVALAQRATAALGGNGARALLREIGEGGDINTPIHIGDLFASGNNAIATMATDGIRLKAEGYKPPPDPGYDAEFRNQQRTTAAAFRFNPDLSAAAQSTAELARLSDQAKGVSHPAAYYWQSALGAGVDGAGHLYGGVATVNGQPTLLPTWLRQDRVSDALQLLGQSWAQHPGHGPVYANGQPWTASDLAKSKLIAAPDGRYVIEGPSGMVARMPGGGAVHLDFDAHRAWLAQRMPDAIRR